MKYQHSRSNHYLNVEQDRALNRSLTLTKPALAKRFGIATLCSTVLLGGCGTLSNNALYGKDGLIHDRSNAYQKVTSSKRLSIPEQLEAKQTQDAMEIPRVGGTSGKSINTIKRPDYFYADSGSESVNVKQDGTGKVVLVDAPINEIWPKAQQFMEFNNLGIADVNPQQGTIESDWVVIKADQFGVVDSWIKKLTFQRVKGDSKNKVRIKLRPQSENNQRTVISMEHVQYPASEEVSAVDWNSEAQNLSYKADMLYELLRFMSKSTSTEQGSGLLASKFKQAQRPGTVLFGRNANGKPALKITGSVENTWRLVENSLVANQIDVGTKDFDDKTFYLTFTSLTPRTVKSRGFFEWLHGDRGPISLSSFGFGDDEDKGGAAKNVSYSSKGQVDSSKEVGITDPNHPANQEGFKVWLGGKVVYNFNRGFNKGFFNADTNMYQLTAGYRLKLLHRGNATFLTVLNKKGEEAASVPAEELLWRIKDSIPRA